MGDDNQRNGQAIMSEVVMHPYREAVAEAKRELAIARTPEAEAMLEAILTAVQRYTDYLEQSGLFYTDPEDPDDMPIVVSEALVITSHPCFGIDVILKNGPCQRVYGLGTDRDPDGRNPPAPPTPSMRIPNLPEG
jgi:hypothetical protein